MFSVLIPVYNHATYVAEAIGSALADASVAEVLLVDDGSADASRDVIRAFRGDSRVRILDDGGGNHGAPARLNQLCREARRDWLAILNSDDAFVAHRFAIARQIIRSERPEMIVGSLVVIDGSGHVIGQKRGPADPEYPFPRNIQAEDLSDKAMLRRLLSQNVVATTSNMIFTRALFERVGGFAEYRFIHDWDFAIRAFLAGRVHVTGAYLTRYRLHATNTIKASDALVDSEVLRMVCALRADFPGLFENEPHRAALASNRHLSASGQAFFARRIRPPESPDPPGRGMDRPADAFGRRVALACAVSRRFAGRQPRRIVPACLPDAPAQPDEGTVHVPTKSPDSAPRPEQFPHDIGDVLPFDERPAVLVLSGFFAVGGVERNTIEIVRHLRDQYRFLVVTFERHTASVGSLHHQLDDLDVPVLDLGHLIAPSAFLDSLAALRVALRPGHVWIVNGATWLVEQAAAVRLLFSDATIIDQQAYDDREGWIGAFHNAGILASDRFIAVNRRIQERFVQTYRIPVQRIDLIYPAIAPERVCDVEEKRGKRHSLERAFGLEGEGLRIGLIGRLSPQKRVDRFLDLAAGSQGSAPPCRFVVVGQGPLEDDLKADVARRGLSHVAFVRYFACASDIGACLDGLVVASDYEGLPIALLEGMAMGIPFLATDVGDIRHVQETYGGGIVLDDWSQSETAFGPWLARWPDLRRELRESRDRLLRDFSAGTLAARYERLFAA